MEGCRRGLTAERRFCADPMRVVNDVHQGAGKLVIHLGDKVENPRKICMMCL